MQKLSSVVLFVIVLFGAASGNHHDHAKQHGHQHQSKNESEYREVALPGSNSSQSVNDFNCYCVSSGFSLFPYEDPKGNSCLGPCSGGDYVFHQQGSLIAIINAWFGCGAPNNGMHGLQIVLRNGASRLLGAACGTLFSITLAKGELISGNIVLGGNGIGTRMGYIGFKTNKGQTFAAGTLHTPYYFPADGSALSGVFGGSGSDVDRLGFFITKPVKYSILQSISYPTLSSITSGLSPKFLAQRTICNNGANSDSETYTFSETTGTDNCWTSQTSLNVEVSLSVTAGAPEIEQVSAGFKWSVGQTNTYQTCAHLSKTASTSMTITAPPHTSCTWRSTQFASALVNLPYNGVVKLVFTDGSSYTTGVSGTYGGVYISKSVTNRNCFSVKSCPKTSGGDDDDDDDDDISMTNSTAITEDGDDDAFVTTDVTTDEDDFVTFELPQNDLLENNPPVDVDINNEAE